VRGVHAKTSRAHSRRRPPSLRKLASTRETVSVECRVACTARDAISRPNQNFGRDLPITDGDSAPIKTFIASQRSAVLSELKRIVSAETLDDTHGVMSWLVDKKQLRSDNAIPLQARQPCSETPLMLTRLALLMLLVLLAQGTQAVAIPAPSQENLEKAVAYLRTVAYNPDLKLCREAPRVAPNVYWLASDNLLAYKALEPYDAQLASAIWSELVGIAEFYNLPTSRDGAPLSLRYDVIIRDDAVLEMPPKDITHLTLYNGSYLLRHDIANGTGRFEDWREYADLLLLVALSNHNRGDDANALGNFTLAANMWDGTGLRDKAYRLDYGEGQAEGLPHAYATYKLGLLLFAAGKLRVNLPFEQDVIASIWSMQNQTSGGIFTHITPGSGWGESDTNTETTAFVILGITGIRNQPPNEIPEFPSAALIVTILAAVFAASMLWIRRRKKAFHQAGRRSLV